MARGKPTFGIMALTITCTDRLRSMRFYNEVLGAVPLPGDLGCPWYRLGPLAITLEPGATRHSPASLPEHAMAMLWLEVDDLEAAHRHFSRHEVEVI